VDRPLSVSCLRCRTSDRTDGGGRGAEALAKALDPAAPVLGSPGRGEPRPWADDLRDSRSCIEAAGRIVGEALDGGRFPVLTASDCTICLSTFPAVAARVPGVRFLWLDAHGDFNSPDTTPSGFLGGMCLAGSCGVWQAGFDAVDPARVVMHGVRDLDPGELRLVEASPVSADLDDLYGSPVYVHLDLDVLDPAVLEPQFAVPGGMHAAELREVLSELDDVVGIEVTAFEAPEDAEETGRRARWVAGLLEPSIGAGRS
jgi:arginase family enzyme